MWGFWRPKTMHFFSVNPPLRNNRFYLFERNYVKRECMEIKRELDNDDFCRAKKVHIN